MKLATEAVHTYRHRWKTVSMLCVVLFTTWIAFAEHIIRLQCQIVNSKPHTFMRVLFIYLSIYLFILLQYIDNTYIALNIADTGHDSPILTFCYNCIKNIGCI